MGQAGELIQLIKREVMYYWYLGFIRTENTHLFNLLMLLKHWVLPGLSH